MAFSTQEAVSNGTLVLLDISIIYTDRTEIAVLFDDVPDALPWAWVGSTDKKISFTPAVPNGVKVTVKRTTDMAAVLHNFEGGAAFTEKSMDENFQQILQIAQEAAEGQLGGDFFQDINMHLHKITNMAPGTVAGDAVEYSQFAVHDAQIIAYKNAAEAAAISANLAYDSFDDRYLGAKAADPALDNDGNALITGALYWNTSVGALRLWNGAVWLYPLSTTAVGVAFTPSGSLSSTNVQAAIEELATEKEPANPNLLETADIGVSVQGYDVDTAKLDVTQGWTAPQRQVPATDNDLSFDLSTRNKFKCTPSAGGVLQFTNLVDGQSGTIMLFNNSNYVITKAAHVKCPSTMLATISATGTYKLHYECDGTSVYVTNSGKLE